MYKNLYKYVYVDVYIHKYTCTTVAVMLKFFYKFIENSRTHKSFAVIFKQEPDLRYLVENVWNSQSVLSAWDDLYDLVLVRWDRLSEWSPWNCVLLTKEEATAHDKLEDVDEVCVYNMNSSVCI